MASTSGDQQQLDERIPKDASKWAKNTLEYLNAEYDKNDCVEFTFERLGISPELRDGMFGELSTELIQDISRIASELARVNDGKEITSDFEFNRAMHLPLSDFVRSFRDLGQILRCDEQKRTPASTSINTPMFTTSDQQYTIPPVFVTPPQQLPLERESVEGSPASTATNQSAKVKHHTSSFANNFLAAAFFSLENHLQKAAWFKHPMRIDHLYHLLPLSSPIFLFIAVLLTQFQNRTENENQS